MPIRSHLLAGWALDCVKSEQDFDLVDGSEAFELTANGKGGWTERVLHNFDGKDGIFVYAGLVFDTSGNLYGTAVEGGTYNHGTAYELMPTVAGSWPARLLHTFNNKDGMYPWATLVRDPAGNLYGTTTGGGEYGYGVVFEITPKH
jgi:uncharacterized repeat protein (TIGR03803 family)